MFDLHHSILSNVFSISFEIHENAYQFTGHTQTNEITNCFNLSLDTCKSVISWATSSCLQFVVICFTTCVWTKVIRKQKTHNKNYAALWDAFMSIWYTLAFQTTWIWLSLVQIQQFDTYQRQTLCVCAPFVSQKYILNKCMRMTVAKISSRDDMIMARPMSNECGKRQAK